MRAIKQGIGNSGDILKIGGRYTSYTWNWVKE